MKLIAKLLAVVGIVLKCIQSTAAHNTTHRALATLNGQNGVVASSLCFLPSGEILTGPALCPDGEVQLLGQYINLGYTWGEQFLASSRQQGKFDDYWPKSYQAFVRFDTWDPNRSALVRDDKKLATTLGLNVFFAETTKLQVNYVRTRNQLNGAASTEAKPETHNLWQVQLNATF